MYDVRFHHLADIFQHPEAPEEKSGHHLDTDIPNLFHILLCRVCLDAG